MNLKKVTSCLGYQQITSLSSATGLTVATDAATGQKARFALIRPLTQSVRWRDDGTNPSGTVGMPLAPGDTLEYDGDLNKIKFIEIAASAELNISYYL